jgi:DNA-binding winged helix-turn-helix (wHTH) protein
VRLGPFTLDDRRFTLSRDGEPVPLSPRLVELLVYLVARPGTLVTKDELLDRFWADVHVTENTLTRAVADIRKALGDDAATPQFIQTVARRGYRFVGAVESVERASTQGSHDHIAATEVDPFIAWARGRVTLEALDATRLDEAIAAFERAVAGAPEHAPAHAGLANAELLRFESTCARNTPDRAALDRALAHARRAAALDAHLGEAWAVLGHVLARQGEGDGARAPIRRAIALEASNWRHHYRLAFASWGEERLRAVDRTLTLLPGFPPAHLLAAMVYVARQAFRPAEEAAARGAEGQHQQTDDGAARFPAAGLHWMRGLVAIGLGDADAALGHFAAEVAEMGKGRVYGQEFQVHALVADGFTRLARTDADAAADRFREALTIVPSHARAMLGLAIASERTSGTTAAIDPMSAKQELIDAGRHTDAALLSVAERAWRNRTSEAVADLSRLIDDAPPGSTAWSVPVDPMLAPLRQAPGLDRVLNRLASRAA